MALAIEGAVESHELDNVRKFIKLPLPRQT